MHTFLNTLSEIELKKIHETSLIILEQTGMVIDHPKACSMLADAGAHVDTQKNTVKFPPELVQQTLTKVPQSYLLAGRDPKHDMILEPGGPFCVRTTSGPTMYVNLENGKLKRASIADMKEFAILGNALPNININGAMHANDVPEQTGDLHSFRVLLENTEKHIYCQIFHPQNLKYMIEMMLAVRGTKEAAIERPILQTIIGIIAPFYLPYDDVEMIFTAGEYGIPMGLCTMPSLGTTAPMTIAGLLAQSNAEVLGILTLIHLVNPGHPTPYYWIPMSSDMRSGTGLLSTPETLLINSVLCQLGRELYKMPVVSDGFFVDSGSIEQVVMQKTQGAMLSCVAGANVIFGAGSADTALTFDPKLLVIDDEIAGMMHRLQKGVDIDTDTLALDVIAKVGPQGNYLAEDHTIKYLRSDEHYVPSILGRDSVEIAYSDDAKKMVGIASEKAMTLLRSHEVPPLSDEVLKELQSIINKADSEAIG